MREIYFDNAATTKVFLQAAEKVQEMMSIEYGNPSSMHRKGFLAEQCVTDARETIARTLKVDKDEIIFTSGGTEANNMALIGAALAGRRKRRHIISSGIEHASVASTLTFLEKEGFEISWLPVDENGLVNPDQLRAALREDTLLVSVMKVNNEIGSVQPVEEIGKIIKAYDSEILFHTDCIQAYGKMPCLPRRWKADLLSVSGHKIHGPKGIGFLYVRKGAKIRPIIWGGSQQKGMRSGTENVPGIAGLALAARMMHDQQDQHMEKVREIKEHFLARVKAEIDHIKDNSGQAPHIASVSFPGVRSEVLLHALEDKGIYVSAGSACSSNKPGVSGTLKGIGLTKDYYESTLRFSFSVFNSLEEADECVEALKDLLPVLRQFTRR